MTIVIRSFIFFCLSPLKDEVGAVAGCIHILHSDSGSNSEQYTNHRRKKA